MEYSMEWIRNDSEIYKLFLENSAMKIFFSERIKTKLKELKIPKGINTNTIELTIWNNIVKKIGFASGGKYLWGLLGNLVKGKIGALWGAVKNWTKEARNVWEWGFNLDKIGNIIDQLQSLGKSFEEGNADSAKIEKLGGLTNSLFEYIDSMLKDYYENLSILSKLGKEKGYINDSGNIIDNNFKTLFDNPIIIDELLTKGEVQKNGININLKSKEMSLSSQSPNSIKSAQDRFMKIVSENTSTGGRKIDKLRKKAKGFAKVLSKLWFDTEGLNELKTKLKSFLPPIGSFLAAILSFFMKGGVESELAKITAGKNIKLSLKNLNSFVKESSHKENLPFTFRDNKGLSVEENKAAKSFLEKVREEEKKLTGKESKRKWTIIDDNNFWKDVTTKDPNSTSITPLMKRVILTIQSLKWTGGAKLSQKDFFQKLKSIKILPDTPKKPGTFDSNKKRNDKTPLTHPIDSIPWKKLTPAQKAALSGAPLVTAVSTSGNSSEVVKILSLKRQIASLKKLPWTLTLKDGRDITINLDDTGKILELWGKKYNIQILAKKAYWSDVFLSASFESWEITLKHWKDSEGNEYKSIDSSKIASLIQTITEKGSVEEKLYNKNNEFTAFLKILPISDTPKTS